MQNYEDAGLGLMVEIADDLPRFHLGPYPRRHIPYGRCRNSAGFSASICN
jgi:hypothetical protein